MYTNNYQQEPIWGHSYSEDVESWKEHLILPFEASNLGNVRHVDTKKPVSLYINNCGYKCTKIYKNKSKSIHTIVAETWIPKRAYCYFDTVDHINRDRLDNRVSNLRWVTHRLNSLNKVNNGKGYYKTWDTGFQCRRRILENDIYFGHYKTEAEAKARSEDMTPRFWKLAVMFENVIEGIRESIREDSKQEVIC